MTHDPNPSPVAGGTYIRAATWPCIVVLATSNGLLSIERQFMVQPRMGTVDPYDVALEFTPYDPATFVTTSLPYESTIVRWDLYRATDLRWLHGNAFDEPLWTGEQDITIVFPTYQGHLA